MSNQVPSENEILAIINSESTEADDVNADADTPGETVLDIVTDQIAQEDTNPPSDDWFWQCPPSAESQQAVVDLVESEWMDNGVTPPTDAELDRIYRQDAGLDISADDSNIDNGLNLVRALAAVLARKPENSRQYKVAATGLRDIVNTGQYSDDARCPSSNKWDRCLVLLRECFAHHFHVTRRVVDSANDVSR